MRSSFHLHQYMQSLYLDLEIRNKPSSQVLKYNSFVVMRCEQQFYGTRTVGGTHNSISESCNPTVHYQYTTKEPCCSVASVLRRRMSRRINGKYAGSDKLGCNSECEVFLEKLPFLLRLYCLYKIMSSGAEKLHHATQNDLEYYSTHRSGRVRVAPHPVMYIAKLQHSILSLQ